MSDNYPEYLNPFAEDVKPKSKLSISHSFKEFKRTLRKSFRIKKKEEEDITIRQKTDTIRRFPVSYPNHQIGALPRSRFRERLTKCEPSTSNPKSGPNPFDEENEIKTSTMKRKIKKKAPLPPKSSSSQNINDDNLEVSNRGSHWSLTSADTDYSFSTEDVNNGTEIEVNGEAMLETFIDFNKEMDKLKDDSNNNLIITENISKETESNNNVPDLVISCDADCTKGKTDEDVNNVEHKAEEEDKSIEETIDNGSSSHVDDNKELIVNDISSNLIVCENNKINIVNEEKESEVSEEPFLYHEKKSIYIPGSMDELNEENTYTGRVSLYITGSSDDLDVSNNNEVCDKKEECDESLNEQVPVPKQRKNKISKNALLGM